jgi:flagellar biosynthetic protein FlhB
MGNSSDKSEKPSLKRVEKARKEGNFPSTRQFLAGFQFLIFVVLLENLGGRWLLELRLVTAAVLSHAFGPPLAPEDWLMLARDTVLRCIGPLVLVGLGMSVLALAVQLGLTGLGLSIEKVAPDLKRLNPISKLKNIANQNVPALFQAVLLLPICGYAIYALASENADRLLALPLKTLDTGSAEVMSTLLSLLWRGAAVFFIFGAVELFREKLRHTRQLRMTKQEVKDEHKESEGNPQIKARIHRIRRDQARKRMMHEVPTATAVVVNPTHYAVALRYDPDTMAAPMVVAKGKNYLALRIRKIALDHQVPLVENPPLAQGLYKAADVGHEIPPHLYRAVAEILAYIVRLMNRR